MPLGLLIGGVKLYGSMYDRSEAKPDHIIHGWGVTKDVPDHIVQLIPDEFFENETIFACNDLDTTINFVRKHQSFNHMNGARC